MKRVATHILTAPGAARAARASQKATVDSTDIELLATASGDALPCLPELFEDVIQSDAFQRRVVEKTRKHFIGKQEAEDEVIVDSKVESEGGVDKALFYFLTQNIKESKLQIYLNALLQRGADPKIINDNQETPLHLAVRKDYKGVCVKLLQHEAIPHLLDRKQQSPFKIAIDARNDDLAALLIKFTSNEIVRRLFSSSIERPSDFSITELFQWDMQETVLAVLDCMVEPMTNSNFTRVYYHVLESDTYGRPADNPNHDFSSKTCFQTIARSGNKTVAFHSVMRLLTRRKWKLFANRRYKLNLFQFLWTMFTLLFSVIVATSTDDPVKYDTPLQIARAVCEVWTLLIVVFVMFLEINQFRKHRLDYWKDQFNWLDSGSCVLLLAVVPLRFTERDEQWYCYSIGFLLWTLRIFKYSTIFRSTGAYAQILWMILRNDFVQFTLVFTVFLITFSGAFILSLRGGNQLHLFNETRDIWHTMFTGVRILIEAERIIDYAGDDGADGFKTLSCILMVLFILFTCVVLLNVLIAQLSDTYQNVQRDAQRGLELNRAWIISRFELNSIFVDSGRKRLYVQYEDIADMKDVLGKWESPPLNEMNVAIKDLTESVESQRLYMRTIQNRQTKLESNLHHIREQLETVIEKQEDQYLKQNSLMKEISEGLRNNNK